MTRTATAQPAKVGDTFHCLVTGVTISTGVGFTGTAHSTVRGENIVLTDALVQAAVDRLGDPGWPAIIHDADAQMDKWGAVRFAPGEAPADIEVWVHGSPEWAEARAFAQNAASREPDHAERVRKLQEVQRRFGNPPATSWSSDRQGEGRDERILREQAERRVADGETYNLKSWTS
ncbi:hypothetical protein [Microbacterium sp. P02]|uniref:hypothetical protein n=1 Tax=Microbacterium sp. P02 TaxID=3366260 RepID=UPI00366B4489